MELLSCPVCVCVCIYVLKTTTASGFKVIPAVRKKKKNQIKKCTGHILLQQYSDVSSGEASSWSILWQQFGFLNIVTHHYAHNICQAVSGGVLKRQNAECIFFKLYVCGTGEAYARKKYHTFYKRRCARQRRYPWYSWFTFFGKRQSQPPPFKKTKRKRINKQINLQEIKNTVSNLQTCCTSKETKYCTLSLTGISLFL